MKMSGRRWMAGVMAAVMAMSALAGCSGGSEATEAAGTTEAAQETTAMAETTATAAAGGSFDGERGRKKRGHQGVGYGGC